MLIMDEPTSALTETEVARLFRVIERLRTRGVTILYISHKMDEVFRLADRITVLRDGRLVRTADRTGETTPREITHLMVGAKSKRPTSPSRRPGRGRARGAKACRSPGPATPGSGGCSDVSFSCGAARSWAWPD